MLKEFPRVRQDPGSYRRLFSDETHDLYVWYDDPRGNIVGFQLLYFEDDEQKVFTWMDGKGCDHMGIDDWDSVRFNKTPLLVTDGVPDYRRLFTEMKGALARVDEDIKSLVLEILEKESGLSSVSV